MRQPVSQIFAREESSESKWPRCSKGNAVNQERKRSTRSGSSAVVMSSWRKRQVFQVSGTNVQVGVDFYNVHWTDLSFGFKAEDWTEFDLTGIAAQDTASQNCWRFYLGE